MFSRNHVKTWMWGDTMELVISHRSAFLFWRKYTGNVGRLASVASPQAMARPTRLSSDLLAELAFLGLNPSAKQPLDLLFSNETTRMRNSAVRAHATLAELPAGALLQVSEHVSVVCPELCYLQLAGLLSPDQLVLAGFELCGTYAQVGEERALAERTQALTSVAAIRAFAAQMPRMKTAAALEALDLVIDGAASPMEAKVAMLLTLPASRGGYGLPQAQLNPELPLPPDARQLYACATVRPDLYWPAARFGVEYDGDVHEGDGTHATDVARSGALRLMDVDELTLSKAQAYDAQAFHALAGTAAKRIGYRLRIRREDFPVRVTRLREELGLV